MRLALVWLALVLLSVSVAAPVAEAFEECRVECTSGSEEDCGTSECCSCCPVGRFVITAAAGPRRPKEPTRERVAVASSLHSDADPRGILHVPKAAL